MLSLRLSLIVQVIGFQFQEDHVNLKKVALFWNYQADPSTHEKYIIKTKVEEVAGVRVK